MAVIDAEPPIIRNDKKIWEINPQSCETLAQAFEMAQLHSRTHIGTERKFYIAPKAEIDTASYLIRMLSTQPNRFHKYENKAIIWLERYGIPKVMIYAISQGESTVDGAFKTVKNNSNQNERMNSKRVARIFGRYPKRAANIIPFPGSQRKTANNL